MTDQKETGDEFNLLYLFEVDGSTKIKTSDCLTPLYGQEAKMYKQVNQMNLTQKVKEAISSALKTEQ